MKFFLSLISLCVCMVLVNPVEKYAKSKMVQEIMRIPPSEHAMDIFALEFKNLVSDVLFFDSIVFVGSKKAAPITHHEGEWLYSILRTSSYLNPYNRDPYYLAESILPWEAQMYEQANILLKQAIHYRDKEWIFPFFVSFNYFYFMNDPANGAEYMKISIDKPEAPTMYLTTLASRLYYRSGQTEVGLLLLKDAWRHATDESVKKIYEKRIKAMEGVLTIEKAINRYKKLYSKQPKSIDVLIRAGLIEAMPVDPYGGKFYIDSDGNVKSTSDFK